MSIMGAIFSKIFPPGHPANPAPIAPPTQSAAVAPAPASTVTIDPTAAVSTTTNALPIPAVPVDVEAVLTTLDSKQTESLNWRTSIVDLMKLLQLDSSLASRKALAQELHYPGNRDDSAPMNVWLHKVVMQKVEDNGGQVPESLKA
jgi:hypothetical protein